MKFLLAAINAKYIHSNLGIYSLKKYAETRREKERQKADKAAEKTQECRVEYAEYTINHQMDAILRDLYKRKPDLIGFSCYIWNISYVKQLIADLKKVLPDAQIWLGGPEVSYDAEKLLETYPQVKGVMTGEGEESFYKLLLSCEQSVDISGAVRWNEEKLDGFLREIPGLVYRDHKAEIQRAGTCFLMNLDEIPFSYQDLTDLEHRIIYYESSRGCPFSCSYCLSSIDKTVRFRSLSLVKQELAFFLDKKVPQVKFVDRTFNCKKNHSMEIWRYLLEHDNGVTNFHFEISADLLDEEELELIQKMRPGLIQLEIGVQTTNPETIREIRRHMDLERLKSAVARVNSFHNVHQHLDLIAGLPYEDYESFKKSFNDVYAMEPEQLQLGFLKVLKGSYMEEMVEEYGLFYQSEPPYEVLSTKWLSYEDVIRLKGIEEMVEIYYNSGQYRNTVPLLEKEFDSAFALYESLSDYYETQGLDRVSHSRLRRYEILYDFIVELESQKGLKSDRETYRDALMVDLYLRENLKSRPSFARDQSTYKEFVREFFIKEEKERNYLPGYEDYDSRQMSKMTHIEGMKDGSMVLFDYKNRDALFGNARAVMISEKQNPLKTNSK